MGPVQATRLLQRALKVTDDGHFGVVTMRAALTADPKALISLVTEQKIAFTRNLNVSNRRM